VDKLIDLDHLKPIFRSLYGSFIRFSFILFYCFIVFILCMCAFVRMIVSFLTNKDSYINIELM